VDNASLRAKLGGLSHGAVELFELDIAPFLDATHTLGGGPPSGDDS
jgi:hypothetical protein